MTLLYSIHLSLGVKTLVGLLVLILAFAVCTAIWRTAADGLTIIFKNLVWYVIGIVGIVAIGYFLLVVYKPHGRNKVLIEQMAHDYQRAQDSIHSDGVQGRADSLDGSRAQAQ